MKNIFLLIFLFIFLSQSSYSFDGNRRGFVIGGGIGFSPVMANDFDLEQDGSRFLSYGQGYTVFIGKGVNNTNLILAGYHEAQGESENLEGRIFQHQFMGVWWYHYFTIDKIIFNTILGFGATDYRLSGHGNFPQYYGFELGIGSEITRHVQFNIVYTNGRFSYAGKSNLQQITLQLHAIAY